MAEIVLSFEDRKLPIHHIPGPEGVRGRNSDNTLIKEKLGWAPTMRLKVNFLFPAVPLYLQPYSKVGFLWEAKLHTANYRERKLIQPLKVFTYCENLTRHIFPLQDGLRITYFWIKEQIEKEKTQGVDLSIYGSSKVVGTQAPVQLGSLRAADGKEWSRRRIWIFAPRKSNIYIYIENLVNNIAFLRKVLMVMNNYEFEQLSWSPVLNMLIMHKGSYFSPNRL